MRFKAYPRSPFLRKGAIRKSDFETFWTAS
nr:MAG TPA: hypothetical protein [Bacteriophage sp.]